MPDAQTGWELKLSQPDQASTVVSQLRNEMPAGYEITDWKEINSSIFEALKMEQQMFHLLMGSLVLVASLNLIASLMLLLYLKRREVAILQSLGLAQCQMRLLFTVYGILLGGVGSVLGLVMALLIGFIINESGFIRIDPQFYFIDRLPFSFSYLFGVVTVLAVTVLAGVISWWGASALRKVSIREGLHDAA